MSASDIQDSVHQAVDLAFSVADLLGSLFSAETEEERRQVKHVLHRNSSGSEVTLSLNSQNQPVISCTGPSSTYATVVPVTTQDQSYPSPVPMQGQLSAQPVTVQGGTQLLFNNFPNYTQGMVTATQIDTAQTPSQTSGVPIAAATLRNFSSNLVSSGAQQSIPLATQTTASNTVVPLLTATVNDKSITVINSDENNPYVYAATVTTAAPTQTFTVPGVVGPGAQYTSAFPAGLTTPVINEITLIVTSYPDQNYTVSPTPGSEPIPSFA